MSSFTIFIQTLVSNSGQMANGSTYLTHQRRCLHPGSQKLPIRGLIILACILHLYPKLSSPGLGVLPHSFSDSCTAEDILTVLVFVSWYLAWISLGPFAPSLFLSHSLLLRTHWVRWPGSVWTISNASGCVLPYIYNHTFEQSCPFPFKFNYNWLAVGS